MRETRGDAAEREAAEPSAPPPPSPKHRAMKSDVEKLAAVGGGGPTIADVLDAVGGSLDISLVDGHEATHMALRSDVRKIALTAVAAATADGKTPGVDEMELRMLNSRYRKRAADADVEGAVGAAAKRPAALASPLLGGGVPLDADPAPPAWLPSAQQPTGDNGAIRAELEVEHSAARPQLHRGSRP